MLPRGCPLGAPVASIMTIAPAPITTALPLPASLVDEAKRVFALYTENPGDAVVWQQVQAFRRTAAAAISNLPVAVKTGDQVEAADQLLNLFYQAGVAEQVPEAEDLELARNYAGKNWPGLLAAMLLVPSWEWPQAPRYDDVPSWMWPAFTVYVFHTPQAFSAVGQAEKYAAHHLKRLEELARWGAANRGSAAVKASLDVYTRRNNCIPLYFSTGSLKRHYELRAKIFALAFNVPRQDDLYPVPREGRKLRVGILSRHFGQQTETYCTLPMFEQMDPERFEIVLFANHLTESVVENHCRQRAAEFHVLPAELEGQLTVIRGAALDVLVLGTNVTAVPNEVMRLALFRLAPLQVVNNSSCTTSGMPESDLYISGALTEAAGAEANFTERLGLIPGPTHAFQYEADRVEPTTAFTRESLGLPADAVVFVSAANYFKITPEMQHAWAKLLAATPGSRLLVHPFNPNWSSSYPIKRFCAEFDRVLAGHGVSTDRLLISTEKFASRNDVKELLRVGDIYLDSFPFGGVNSLVDPLELGIPTIAWEGTTFRARMGGSLLRTIGLDELVADDESSYLRLGAELAVQRERRSALSERIRAAMERSPLFLDTLAYGDAIGGLLETAFDELLAVGRPAFRKEKAPLKAVVSDVKAELAEGENLLSLGMCGQAMAHAQRVLAVDSAQPEARHLLGRALLGLGRPARAVSYLLEAIQRTENNTALWCDLAHALRQNGQIKEALEAVQACLGMDGRHLEAILLLGDLAESVGQLGEIGEAVQIAREVAPNDPRVQALVAKTLVA
ncbi:tetratricopeptide repeat protein [Nibricoccus aquaticus]|uniref:O-linked N-acetylglucosamine transferase family protein n=1 Tax=Nibricoccus aquaticus TaxID=2576891 RepID=UPI001586D5EE|nr:tetratricopeptide repeat protein [Nibricoccus aquaticus]